MILEALPRILIVGEDTRAAVSSRLFPGFSSLARIQRLRGPQGPESPPLSRLPGSVSKGLSTYTKDETESLLAVSKDHPRDLFASGGSSPPPRMPLILHGCVVLEALYGPPPPNKKMWTPSKRRKIMVLVLLSAAFARFSVSCM